MFSVLKYLYGLLYKKYISLGVIWNLKFYTTTKNIDFSKSINLLFCIYTFSLDIINLNIGMVLKNLLI